MLTIVRTILFRGEYQQAQVNLDVAVVMKTSWQGEAVELPVLASLADPWNILMRRDVKTQLQLQVNQLSPLQREGVAVIRDSGGWFLVALGIGDVF